ncbi:uncharacterized protein METZ01_LOCUS344031 [marine metagenome]|uniref:Uncharacterized protein n=1 Tax=marine metagenome TaxID=408172 RepID=A0A382R1S0_9ZZZZ
MSDLNHYNRVQIISMIVCTALMIGYILIVSYVL